jgi:putative CocE/NonD family hydrolase
MRRLRTLFLPVLFFLFVGGGAVAADADHDLAAFIRSHYTKYEVRIPMRDGVTLFAAVYVPSDASAERTYPILLTRTPYSAAPYGADRYPDTLGPSPEFAREGYIFVTEDVRGRFMSEGTFVNMRPILDGPKDGLTDESTDAWDTVDWLVHHVPSNNGKVGIWGNSYPGFYTATGIIDTHPAIKAALPSAPIADWFFDDMHHRGAFSLTLTFDFFSVFGVPRNGLTTGWPERFDPKTPDGYQFFLDLGPLSNVDARYFHDTIPFWEDIAAHPNYDAFWATRSTLRHLENVRCAVLVVGGLFDAEDLYGAFHTYAAIEKNNPQAVNSLVMGPWRHGAWLRGDGRRLGEADFGFDTAVDFRERVLLPFFAHYLKGAPAPPIPEAMVFETGANRWRSFDRWPPARAASRDLYLDTGCRLSWHTPEKGDEDFDAYVSDPARPVPYTTAITTRWHAEYMTEDQRFAARRPDVLVYRSEPLAEDLTVAGPLEADLWVSTTGTDADWVVKLIDEYPGRLPGYDPKEGGEDLGGTQRLVRSEIFRGRFREGYDRPAPFTPDRITRVRIPLQGVLHTFLHDHRVMVQVQSTLFPFFDRNPQTFVPNIFEARQEDFVKATERVYHSPSHASVLHVGVLPPPIEGASGGPAEGGLSAGHD